jgi:acetylornithine deacetylase/succinyl-diaminopimelate desuccinylase-like protein
MSLAAVLARVDADLDAALARLFDLVRIPSISADPAFKADVARAADWCAAELTSLGFQATVRPTTGHPMVVADWTGKTAKAHPHVLFYGHYDVQPVDPLELWTKPPFEPFVGTRTDGTKFIHGRGSADDKGQFMTFIEACRAHLAETGMLPCPVTILLEGEEESGSPSLGAFLDSHKDELSKDVALICDTGMWNATTPAITASLRGLVGEEVTIDAATVDLHSGLYGGAALNPVRVLAKILAGLHDDTGAVTLPGFYDGVAELPDDIKASWEALDLTPASFLAPVGLSEPAGETGRSMAEQLWARPTCEFNGISGGYAGEGFKTVLPAKAQAKVSFRLVPGQDPDKIRAAFRAYVTANAPKDAKVSFKPHGGSPGLIMPFDDPILTTAQQALSEEWGVKAEIIGGGGSIPIVGDFRRRLGMASLLVGFGLDDDRVHSPNEKYEMSSFHKGIRSWARILAAL